MLQRADAMQPQFQSALFHSLAELPPALRAWMASDPATGVYGHPDWYANLWTEALQAGGGEPAIHVLLRHGTPVLALPLLLEAGGHTARSLANFYTPLALPTLGPSAETADVDAWQALFSAVRRAHPRVSSLHLGPLPQPLALPGSPLRQGLRQAGYATLPYFGFGNWFMRPTVPWATYWAQRPAALRNTVERKGRKFAALGGTLRLYRGTDDLETGIQAFQRIYAESWKGPEPHPHFMPGLMRWAAQAGWLRLGVAWLNGEPVAAQVWLCAFGKTDIYKLAYREQHRALGAGSLLTAALMQQAMEVDGSAEIDYLMGDDPYKADWVDQRRERWAVAAYALHRPRGLWGWLKQWGGQQGRRLRPPSHPTAVAQA